MAAWGASFLRSVQILRSRTASAPPHRTRDGALYSGPWFSKKSERPDALRSATPVARVERPGGKPRRRRPFLLAAGLLLAVAAAPRPLAAQPPADPPLADPPLAAQPPAESTTPADAAAAALHRARERLAAGDRAGAVAALEPLRDDPAAPLPAIAFLAGLYVETERAEEALALLEPRIEAAGPAAGELLFVAARAARALGRGEQAEAYLERSAALAPQSRAAVLLATLRTQAGRHAEAVALLAPIVDGEAFAAVVRQNPGFAFEILVHYGRELSALERFADAVAPLRRAVEIRPEDAAAWRLLGEALVESDDVDAAQRALQTAQQLEESAHEQAVERTVQREQARELVEESTRLHAEGRNDEALERLRRAAELAPDDPLPRMVEVRLLVTLGRRDEALSRAEELVARRPGDPQALHLRGMTRYAFGDPAAAEADLRRALELAPDNPPSLGGLALALIAQDRLDEAAEVLARVPPEGAEDELVRRAHRLLAESRPPAAP